VNTGFNANPQIVGSINQRREQIVSLVKGAGHDGMTCAELEPKFNSYHGPISGALSMLNKSGQLICLTDKRVYGNRNNRIYVHPDFVDGRTPFKMGG
jgi:hypothetical protein